MNTRMSHHFDRGLHPKAECSLSFVVCCSDNAMLKANLLSSLASTRRLLTRSSRFATLRVPRTGSMRVSLGRAMTWLSVFIRTSSFPPVGIGWCSTSTGWPSNGAGTHRRCRSLRRGPASGRILLQRVPLAAERIGWVVDRGRILSKGPVMYLCHGRDPGRIGPDRPAGYTVAFDPELGFHLYGADICLQARERGLAVVALDSACCHHNSRSIGLPEVFFASALGFCSQVGALGCRITTPVRRLRSRRSGPLARQRRQPSGIDRTSGRLMQTGMKSGSGRRGSP